MSTSSRVGSALASPRRWLLLGLLGWAACTCQPDDESPQAATRHRAPTSTRPLWASACVTEPRQVLGDVSALLGNAHGGRALPTDPERLAMHFGGLSQDQLEGVVDWEAPAVLLLFDPGRDRPLAEGLALRFGRPESEQGLTTPTGRRRVQTSEGSLHLNADRRTVWISRHERTLDAALARAEAVVCAPGDDDENVEVVVTPELLASPPVTSWIARNAAWLEATARQGTARHGRSELGDPEAAARAIAGWAERTRERLEGEAPLRTRLTLSPETLRARLTGEGGDEARPLEPSAGRLGLVAPDSYLVLSGRSSGEARRETIEAAVEVIARVAGDRLTDDERSWLHADLTALASTADGWVTFALRPSLEPGPLVALAALECSDPAAAATALDTLARHLTDQGFFRSALGHLGATIRSTEGRSDAGPDGTGSGEVAWSIEGPVTNAPPDAGPGGPEGLHRLTGPRPTLAWRHRDGLLLVAFGQQPREELNRMVEALDGEAPASVLAQPVLRRSQEAVERSEWLVYGWLPAVAALLTHGGPGAAGLPPGGFALIRGRDDEGASRWTLQMDRAQVRSMVRLFAGGRSR